MTDHPVDRRRQRAAGADGRAVGETNAQGTAVERDTGEPGVKTDARGPAAERDERAGDGTGRRLATLDRVVYALFAGHADDPRHEADRRRFRGVIRGGTFDLFLARTYAVSWVVATLVGLPAAVVSWRIGGPAGGLVAGIVTGVVGKWLTVQAAGLALRVLASARRSSIRRTLPGAARYLHALSSGADDARGMLRRVGQTAAYGETARAIRVALTTATLTGSLRRGLERVARDTPARETLAPFLLQFREHAQQGEDALAEFLRLESRVLGHQRERARDRRSDAMELVGELFVVLLVLPALLVIVVTVMSVLAPGFGAPIATPVGTTTGRALVAYGATLFVLATGAGGAAAVATLRPGTRGGYDRPAGTLATLRSVGWNPTSAATVLAVPAIALVAVGWWHGWSATDALVGGYVAFAVPVGAVAWRRARRDDAKDSRITDFVHAVSGHVGLGRPLPRAVELVARDVELGPLDPDVADLAFNLRHAGRRGEDTHTAALERFVDRVGTPFAGQTVGLLIGALEAGSDTEAVFETLRTEAGRLHHQRRAIRSNMLVYVAVGWTTALLVVGIVIAVDTQVIDAFSQLSTLSATEGIGLEAGSIDPARTRERFRLVTEATTLASGWFAGMADRGLYAALLHSGLLVVCTRCCFAVVGA